jgi:Abnormal spindle-like microcephaly-assoc'd, ASPM-SPD-2-Hydin
MSRRVIATFAAAVVAVLVVAVPTAFAATSALTLSPSVVTLGHVSVGTTTERTVTLTNTGSEALTLTSFEAFGYNGNFTVDPGTCTLGTTLEGGQSCSFSVLTSPSVVGAIRGQFCYTGVGETTSDRVCGRITGSAS